MMVAKNPGQIESLRGPWLGGAFVGGEPSKTRRDWFFRCSVALERPIGNNRLTASRADYAAFDRRRLAISYRANRTLLMSFRARLAEEGV